MSSPADVPRPAPRTCPGCEQTDTDPRHVMSAVVGDEAPPGWHHDCHAAMGCRVCLQIVRDADGVTGDAMLAHKLTLIDNDSQEG
jgi:hypothetical protein